ncbi:MAG: hypothetical protein FWF10_04095 [Clostridiales bacterium]|nr:hypothetical protein [Clostridiales bacterium]
MKGTDEGMIQIMKIESMDETAFDHVKCPQCHKKLCGKPKGTRVSVLHFAKVIHESPLLFTCRRCGHHYLVSTLAE